MVFPEQASRMAEHPVPDRAEPTENFQRGFPLSDIQPFQRDTAPVSQGLQHLPAAETTQRRHQSRDLLLGHFSVRFLRLPEHHSQVLQGLLTGVSGRLGKVPDEVVPADFPSTTQAKEAEQIPELDGINLHRRGRH
jgi:hypothetical protein